MDQSKLFQGDSSTEDPREKKNLKVEWEKKECLKDAESISWEKPGRRAADPILNQQPVKPLPTLWYVLWCPKANMETGMLLFFFG